MPRMRFAGALLALGLSTFLPLAAPADAQDARQDTSYATESQSGQARAEMMERFGVTELQPGKFLWASTIPAGPTRIVISLTDQMGYVFRANELVGVTTLSSGKTEHETPIGVFPILGKERLHRSKTYENAPMPFMQRLNEYGVALHAGNVPGYPASHGCVRLPMKFAARLFELTQTGTPVIIEA